MTQRRIMFMNTKKNALFKQIKDFNKTLEECKKSLDSIAKDMKKMSGSKSTQS